MFLLALCLAFVEPPLSDQVACIEADYAALEKSFHEELVAAQHDDEKVSEANRTYQTKRFAFIEELTALIKAHPGDPAAVDGLIALTGSMRTFLNRVQIETRSFSPAGLA